MIQLGLKSDLDFLAHHGVKGMKWGARKSKFWVKKPDKKYFNIAYMKPEDWKIIGNKKNAKSNSTSKKSSPKPVKSIMDSSRVKTGASMVTSALNKHVTGIKHNPSIEKGINTLKKRLHNQIGG